MAAAMSGQIRHLTLDQDAAEIRILIQDAFDILYDAGDRIDPLVHIKADRERR